MTRERRYFSDEFKREAVRVPTSNTKQPSWNPPYRSCLSAIGRPMNWESSPAYWRRTRANSDGYWSDTCASRMPLVASNARVDHRNVPKPTCNRL